MNTYRFIMTEDHLCFPMKDFALLMYRYYMPLDLLAAFFKAHHCLDSDHPRFSMEGLVYPILFARLFICLLLSSKYIIIWILIWIYYFLFYIVKQSFKCSNQKIQLFESKCLMASIKYGKNVMSCISISASVERLILSF